MQSPIDILQHYWGFESFRPPQLEIINEVLGNRDTLALLPTGGGKSVCFQVPGLAMDGICIVVSPLIALMNDQVNNLRKNGIKAIAIHSGLSYREIDQGLDSCVYGDIKFLYVSPERLKTETFRARFQRMKVNLIAVDEAHCISQWGYDFRPAYLEIAELRDIHPKVPILALTATATPEVVTDIQDQLRFKEHNVLKKSFARNNLAYVVIREESKRSRLLSICINLKGSGVVYVRNRRKTEEIASFLNSENVQAKSYHAGLEMASRDERQRAWSEGSVQVMVATNAFGMGIDKSNVRFVVHLDLPDDLESYFQEAGRAGRDGKKSYAVILLEENDIKTLGEKVQRKYPSEDTVRKVYRSILNHLQLAAGAGEHISYEVDLPMISKKSGIPSIDLYNSLKVLETEDYLSLSESFYRPNRIRFIVNNDVLYDFQLRNQNMDALIQVLLRSYSGLFETLVNVDPKKMAKRLQWPVAKVEQQLQSLADHHIIEYHPASDASLITFTQPAQYDRSLKLSKEGYQRRKALAREKFESVINYVGDGVCRQRRLLRYFGEESTSDCGICDVCLDKKRSELDVAKLEFKILSAVRERTMRPDELTIHLAAYKKETVLKTLKWLLDQQILYYTQEKCLAVNEKLAPAETDIKR